MFTALALIHASTPRHPNTPHHTQSAYDLKLLLQQQTQQHEHSHPHTSSLPPHPPSLDTNDSNSRHAHTPSANELHSHSDWTTFRAQLCQQHSLPPTSPWTPHLLSTACTHVLSALECCHSSTQTSSAHTSPTPHTPLSRSAAVWGLADVLCAFTHLNTHIHALEQQNQQQTQTSAALPTPPSHSLSLAERLLCALEATLPTMPRRAFHSVATVMPDLASRLRASGMRVHDT